MHARAIRCDDCKEPICPDCVQMHKKIKNFLLHNITELPIKLRCDQAAVSVPEKIDKQKGLSMPTKTRAEEVVRIQGKSNGDKGR